MPADEFDRLAAELALSRARVVTLASPALCPGFTARHEREIACA